MKARVPGETSEYKPTRLDQILKRCQYYLYMPDTGPIEIALGAVAANRMPGDPVWPLLISPPGGGKTEVINCLNQVKDIHRVAVLTEASLLSGTTKQDSQGAKGGLLREIGDFGIMLVKDFGGILSLTRQSRGPNAALGGEGRANRRGHTFYRPALCGHGGPG